jgi:hypothetical protein
MAGPRSAHPLIGLYGDGGHPARDKLPGHQSGPGGEVKDTVLVPAQQP